MVRHQPVILCVDDEEVPLTLRKLVLEKEGYAVVIATSAAEALEILSSQPIDLVLSDHLMPGKTGTELARQIKSSTPDLPVIVFSGLNEMPVDAEVADAFISKIVGPKILCEKIASLLTHRSKNPSNT